MNQSTKIIRVTKAIKAAENNRVDRIKRRHYAGRNMTYKGVEKTKDFSLHTTKVIFLKFFAQSLYSIIKLSSTIKVKKLNCIESKIASINHYQASLTLIK